MNNQYIITEWLLETKDEELNIYIYKLNNFEFRDSFYFNNIAKKSLDLFSIRDTYIGLWKPIENIENINFYINKKNITINKINYTEIDNFKLIRKRLMELLISETIKKLQNKNKKWKIMKNNYFMSYDYKDIIIKNYGKYEKLEVYKKLKINCSVKDNGDIHIIFFPKIMVTSKENVTNLTFIKKDTIMIDIFTGSRILFSKKTDDNIKSYLEPLNMSLFEYLKEKNEYTFLNYEPSINNNNIIAYYPNTINIFKEPKKYTFSSDFLKLDKNNCIMNKDFTGQYNIDTCINDVNELLINTKKYISINFNKSGLDIKNHGYIYNELKLPEYNIENKNGITNNIQDIIKDNSNKFIKKRFDFLIDLHIIVCLKESEEIKNNINIFVNKLKDFSINKDINIKFQKPVFIMVDGKQFLYKYYKNVLNSKPAIIIFDGSNIQYQNIKQTFSLWGISNQCVNYNKIIKKDKVDEIKVINMVPNILLGLYFKCGKYPWILNNKFNSDCFIGIDVSHENDKHIVSCVIYIFSNKELIFREIGKEITDKDYEDGEKKKDKGVEKIPRKIVNYIFDKLFENLKNKKINIKSIVIHRDGFCRDTEKNAIIDNLNKRNVKFAIVSILKKVYRKIVKYNNKIYSTEISSYINKNVAYIITNNVYKYKLANPFKIELIENNFDYTINNAVNDVYYLTYMCFHSIMKPRLPATIQYSDKCSTSHNRKYISTDKLYEKVFQA